MVFKILLVLKHRATSVTLGYSMGDFEVVPITLSIVELDTQLDNNILYAP
jgi:hypothetical protein